MELEVQKYLRSGKNLKDLETEFGINSCQHSTIPQLYSLKYDQINSPSNHPIVVECRGLILDSSNNWNIVSFPFKRFFNDGDSNAAKIDWDRAVVQEKLDGSLMHLYHYDSKWHVASSGTPDAGGNVNGFTQTFAGLFWEIWNQLGYKLPQGYENYTFIFEMMSPLNRIVVPHTTSNLVLIGIRDNISGNEWELSWFKTILNYRFVKTFPLNSAKSIIDSFNTFKGLNQEGYVVVDANFNRIKVKHPEYVALHRLKGNGVPTPKRMLELIMLNEGDEVLAYFPEFKPIYNDVLNKYSAAVKRITEDFSEAIEALTSFSMQNPIASPADRQKFFASFATKSICSAALFNLKKGSVDTVEQHFQSISIDKVMQIIGIK